METTARKTSLLSRIAQLVAAVILGMASFAKLTSNPDSIKLFTDLGAEPAGRLLVGTVEAVITILLLVPRTARIGGLLTVALMLGAITTHIVKLGIRYPNGDPTLFTMAVVALTAGLVVVRYNRAI